MPTPVVAPSNNLHHPHPTQPLPPQTNSTQTNPLHAKPTHLEHLPSLTPLDSNTIPVHARFPEPSDTHTSDTHTSDVSTSDSVHTSDSTRTQTREPIHSLTSDPCDGAAADAVPRLAATLPEHRRAHTPRRIRARTLETLRTRNEHGAATAEYAVTIVAACGLGGILVALLKSPLMQNALKAILNYALKLAGVDGVHL